MWTQALEHVSLSACQQSLGTELLLAQLVAQAPDCVHLQEELAAAPLGWVWAAWSVAQTCITTRHLNCCRGSRMQ